MSYPLRQLSDIRISLLQRTVIAFRINTTAATAARNYNKKAQFTITTCFTTESWRSKKHWTIRVTI